MESELELQLFRFGLSSMFRSYWFYKVPIVFKGLWLKKNNARILDLETIYILCIIDVANSFKYCFPISRYIIVHIILSYTYLLIMNFRDLFLFYCVLFSRYIVDDFDIQLVPSMAV